MVQIFNEEIVEKEIIRYAKFLFVDRIKGCLLMKQPLITLL